MKSEWKQKTLGELLSYITKGIPPKYTETENDNTIHVLNQKCNRDFNITFDYSRLHDNSQKKVPDEKLLKTGDVLINSTGAGTAGRVAQLFELPFPTTIDGHMILLRPTSEIEIYYFGYAIKQWQTAIEALAEGSTGQTEINRQRLCDEIIITYPSDKEHQKRISSLLFDIDQKIAINNAINENLLQQSQSIFKNMFPDILSSNGETTLEHLIEFTNGKKRPQLSGNFPVYGGNGILAYTSNFNAENCVIIGRVGAYCGNTFLCTGNCWVSDNAIQAKSKTSKSQLFIYYLLRNAALPSRHIGTGQPLMTQGILNAIPISLPEEAQINRFNEVTDPIQKMIDKNNVENKYLTDIRENILPKLMSGELEVADFTL